MRATNVVLNVMSLLLVAAGLGLISTFFFPSIFLQPAASGNIAASSPADFNVPELSEETTPEPIPETTTATEKDNPDATKNEQASGNPDNSDRQGSDQQGRSEEQGSGERKEASEARKQEEARPAVPVPEDKTLWVTVPTMNRVQSAPMPYTTGDDEASLKAYAGIHLQGTGFPWQEEANVYMAGHRLGYPNTDSFLAFWDLNKVDEGDEVYVTDAMGRSYTYRVFKELVVDPSDLFVTRPIEGKNILTLQTCTLPDYSQRLIVQAEKVA